MISSQGIMSSQWIRWIQQIQRVLSFAGGIAWGIVNKADSLLSDIETRPHSMLQTILGTGDRHITAAENAEITAIDGLAAGMTAKTGNATYAARTITGTTDEITVTNGDGISGNPTLELPDRISTPRKFGTATDYTEFEANGFQYFAGNAGGYDDVQFNITPKSTGPGHPILTSWNTDFEEYAYAVGDHTNAQSQEAPHWWKEGSSWDFHIHWTTGSGNYVAGDKVQWEIRISAADTFGSSPYTQFPAAAVLVIEHTFVDTVLPFSGVRSIFPTFNIPATMTKVGAQVKIKLTRIAKTAGGTDPATPPFALQIGAHALADTRTTRTTGAK